MLRLGEWPLPSDRPGCGVSLELGGMFRRLHDVASLSTLGRCLVVASEWMCFMSLPLFGCDSGRGTGVRLTGVGVRSGRPWHLKSAGRQFHFEQTQDSRVSEMGLRSIREPFTLYPKFLLHIFPVS